jgi:ribosome-binding factor A
LICTAQNFEAKFVCPAASDQSAAKPFRALQDQRMSPANHRHLRVGEEIAHEINAMLVGELKDPRLEGMVVANEVRVQQDMKHARVFISVQGTEKEQSDAVKALEHAAGYIRRELIERLQLRRVPELHFTLDLSQENVQRIEQLLKEVKKTNPPPQT